MEILTSKEMEKADAFTINQLGVPSTVLMEHAALAVYNVLESIDGLDKSKIALFIGSGNNGGDGLALSRILLSNGYNIEIILTSSPENFRGDTKLNYDILSKYPALFINNYLNEEFHLSEYSLIIDAIFGTGLSRSVEGRYKEIIKEINRSSIFKISVDIPSGLSGMSSAIIGEHVSADITVTFCRPKILHCLYPARKYCGKVMVADITIPDFSVTRLDLSTYLVTENNLPLLFKREKDSHKGHFGHAVIIGGSKGKTGAPIMSNMACIRSGAGLTTCVIPGNLNTIFESFVAEAMSFPLGDCDYFNVYEIEEVLAFLNDKTVCALGPGIGREASTKEFVNKIIENTLIPIVIDADGINTLDDKSFEFMRNRSVITPHIGEFARLLKIDKEELLRDRLDMVREFSMKNGVVTVLKSADTLIADPQGLVYVNITGNTSLAKGGSGDCLTGLITGFISQGYNLVDSAILGCYIMGKTGEMLSQEKNERFIITTDIIHNMWKVFNEITLHQQQYFRNRKNSIITI